jgi:predicted DNA-binding transcriptional regulator YafY
LFRLDRIQSATLHDERFVPPTNFDYLGYVIKNVVVWGEAYPVEVVLGLELEAARRRVPPGYGVLEPETDGVLLCTQVDDLDWFAKFLLGLGCPIVVRKPSELKDALRRAATEIVLIAENA